MYQSIDRLIHKQKFPLEKKKKYNPSMSLKVIPGRLQQDMGWGRKEGQGYLGLFNEREIKYLASTPKEFPQMKVL